MRQLVLPAFEHYTLREITVRKVDQFIKTLAATKSYSMAKQARTVLSLAFGLAVRYDAHPEEPCARHRPAAQAAVAGDGPDPRAGRGDPRRRPRLAARHRPAGPEARRPAGADHRGHARDLGPDRRGARDPQVRCRRHGLAGDCADLRHDRLAGGQADPSTAPPQDAEVDPDGVGPVLRRRGLPPATGPARERGSRSPDLLHPQRHAADDQQRPPSAAGRARRGRDRRASHRTRSGAPSPPSSTERAARISPPRCWVTPPRRSPRSTTSSPTRR